jgi:hypothetical protein
MVDDDGFQDDREIWEVSHVSEQDLETTEGEGVDFLAELLPRSWWDGHRSTTRRRRRTSLDYGIDAGLKYCVEHGLSFLINIVEPTQGQQRPLLSLGGLGWVQQCKNPFYHNWTDSILQQLKRNFWKIADALFRISPMTNSFKYTV